MSLIRVLGKRVVSDEAFRRRTPLPDGHIPPCVTITDASADKSAFWAFTVLRASLPATTKTIRAAFKGFCAARISPSRSDACTDPLILKAAPWYSTPTLSDQRAKAGLDSGRPTKTTS